MFLSPWGKLGERVNATVDASLRALAGSIRNPMPLLPPTVSEITEPMKASVIATFTLAKRLGMACGMPTLVRISARVAPSLNLRFLILADGESVHYALSGITHVQLPATLALRTP
jgi:hypothetical protein